MPWLLSLPKNPPGRPELTIDRDPSNSVPLHPEDLRLRLPAAVRHTDNSHGTKVLLHDHRPFLNLGQPGIYVAREVGFGDAYYRHVSDRSVSPPQHRGGLVVP